MPEVPDKVTRFAAEEGVAFNAGVSAAIESNLAAIHYGQALAVEGVTTVVLDDQGRLVEYLPDGTSTILLRQLRTSSASPSPER